MSDPMAITIIKKAYLISNRHLAEEINEYKSVDVQWRSPPSTWVDGNVKQGIYRSTWIMFAQIKRPVEIHHPRHGVGVAYKKHIEVHRYIENATLSNQLSKSKTVNIEEIMPQGSIHTLAGKIARVVKLADLLDHVSGPTPCPPNLKKRYEKSLYRLISKGFA